jgi:hypothetical protein
MPIKDIALRFIFYLFILVSSYLYQMHINLNFSIPTLIIEMSTFTLFFCHSKNVLLFPENAYLTEVKKCFTVIHSISGLLLYLLKSDSAAPFALNQENSTRSLMTFIMFFSYLTFAPRFHIIHHSRLGQRLVHICHHLQLRTWRSFAKHLPTAVEVSCSTSTIWSCIIHSWGSRAAVC